MTDKQKKFCEEYLTDLNATQAAIRAGYSEKTAGSIGDENLKKPEIKKYIAELQAEGQERNQIKRDDILGELKKIGFADIDLECISTKDMQSENVNDFQKFADSILFLRGITLDDDDKKKLRDKNVLESYEETGDAQWLVKTVNDAYIENMKTRLVSDIYQLSGTVNMSDENFGNNLSGVAIKYKLMSMENRVAKTERYFKKALQRRFEMICHFLNLEGGNYDYTQIGITFKRNIPVNISEYATIAQQLSGIVSKETLLTLFPFVSDAGAELERLETEKGDYDKNAFDTEQL